MIYNIYFQIICISDFGEKIPTDIVNKKSLNTYIEENIFNLFNTQRPGFFDKCDKTFKNKIQKTFKSKSSNKNKRNNKISIDSTSALYPNDNKINRDFVSIGATSDFKKFKKNRKNVNSFNKAFKKLNPNDNNTLSKKNVVNRIINKDIFDRNIDSEIQNQISDDNFYIENFNAITNRTNEKITISTEKSKIINYQTQLLKRKGSKNKLLKEHKESNNFTLLNNAPTHVNSHRYLINYIDDNFMTSTDGKNYTSNINKNYKLKMSPKKEEERHNNNLSRVSSSINTFLNHSIKKNFQDTQSLHGYSTINSVSDHKLSRVNTLNTNNKIKKKENESNQVFLSGAHAAKIRLLKGIDLHGNIIRPGTFLNVNCIGLKANFNFDYANNNSSKKTIGPDGSTIMMRQDINNGSQQKFVTKSSSEKFPQIIKKE